MGNFNGVSTKHLNNYLIWHNFVNYAKGSAIDKKSILLRFALTQSIVVRVKDIAKNAKITENEALLGMGWLFKEGKITDEEGLIKLA